MAMTVLVGNDSNTFIQLNCTWEIQKKAFIYNTWSILVPFNPMKTTPRENTSKACEHVIFYTKSSNRSHPSMPKPHPTPAQKNTLPPLKTTATKTTLAATTLNCNCWNTWPLKRSNYGPSPLHCVAVSCFKHGTTTNDCLIWKDPSLGCCTNVCSR